MIGSLPHILAQDGDDVAKIIFGVFFALIWALSALASWVNKKQQEARRQRTREQMARMPAPPAPPPMPRRIAEGLAQRHPEVLRPPMPAPPPPPPIRQQPRQRVPVPPPVPSQARGSKAATKHQRAAQKAAQEAARRAAEFRAYEEDQQQRRRSADARRAAQVAPATPARRQPTAVTAPAIRDWLTPETLRSQFILTEILQPPVSTRERHLAD